MIDSVKFIETSLGIEMRCEKEFGPFEEYTVGTFLEGTDGYWRFLAGDDPITCKQLWQAHRKVSELNQ